MNEGLFFTSPTNCLERYFNWAYTQWRNWCCWANWNMLFSLWKLLSFKDTTKISKRRWTTRNPLQIATTFEIVQLHSRVAWVIHNTGTNLSLWDTRDKSMCVFFYIFFSVSPFVRCKSAVFTRATYIFHIKNIPKCKYLDNEYAFVTSF